LKGEFAVSEESENSRKPLELTIRIRVGHKDPDALTRLLFKQREELLSAAETIL
jgi:hypothetical protein